MTGALWAIAAGVFAIATEVAAGARSLSRWTLLLYRLAIACCVALSLWWTLP